MAGKPGRQESRLSAWSRRAVQLLSDGGWHDLDEIMTECKKKVPPAMAFRTAERRRKWARERRKNKGLNVLPPRQRPKADYWTAVDAGAADIVRGSLRAVQGFEQRIGPGGRRQIRDTMAEQALWNPSVNTDWPEQMTQLLKEDMQAPQNPP